MNIPFVIRNTPYVIQYLYYGTLFTSSMQSTITASGTLYMQGKTGTDRLIHFLSLQFSHNGTDVSFEIYEDPTFTADGTALVSAINQNRESIKTAQWTAYSDPPIPTAGGTLISRDRIFGSSGGVGQSVSAAALTIAGIERIMKKDTDYSLKIINNAAIDTTFLVNWQWYESGN